MVGPAGAAASNLSGISVSISQGYLVTQYTFNVTVNAGDFTAERDKLLNIQRAIANSATQLVSWTTSYSVTDDDVSKAIEAALPALLERAKAQATVLANAMNADLGKLSTLSTPAVARAGLNLTVSATATYTVMAR